MKRILPLGIASILLTTLLISAASFAQPAILPDDDSSDVDDASPASRAARVSFIEGDVSFLRAGVTEWAAAVENLPLLAGDQIYAGRGARAEIQLARNNYIRLSENTELTITTLSDSAAQLEITEGTAIIRIERLSSVFGRFEVDTPNSAFVIEQDGLYRVAVRGENNSELAVRRGEADLSTDAGTLKVREGQRVFIDTGTGGKLELAADTSRDEWDEWSHDRDTVIARTTTDSAPDYVNNYETTYNDFYGASDLSGYGTWTSYSSYGQCWVPRVSSDWAPYRAGQWLWIPNAGWSWLSSEPWGWAPYHYGRWAFLSGIGWAWIPGFGSSYRGYGYRDYHWRPALVGFFNSQTPRGHYVGWYPLAPGERWRRARGNEHGHLQYPIARGGARRPDGRDADRPTARRGITILPSDGFGRGDRSGARPSAPSREVSDWINRGARPGLPEIRPTPVAAAPSLAENDRRGRRLVIPPREIVNRPVVTRNPNADATAGAARERRWIAPRKPIDVSRGPVLVEDHSDRKANRRARQAEANDGSRTAKDSNDGSRATKDSSDGERQAPKIRVPVPPPTEKANDEGARERRRARERDAAGGSQSSDGDAQSGEERRRARRERNAAQSGEGNSSSGDQRNNETRARERKPPDVDQPRDDARSRNRADQGGSRDRGGESQRATPGQDQPRSEPRDQAHQERREEKRQERQQQQEQRKRP